MAYHSAFVVRSTLASENEKPVPANVWLRTRICAWICASVRLPSAAVGPLLMTWKCVGMTTAKRLGTFGVSPAGISMSLASITFSVRPRAAPRTAAWSPSSPPRPADVSGRNALQPAQAVLAVPCSAEPAAGEAATAAASVLTAITAAWRPRIRCIGNPRPSMCGGKLARERRLHTQRFEQGVVVGDAAAVVAGDR